MTKYNGWTNYATWRVNLEMFDGIDPREMYGSDVTLADLTTYLREEARSILENETGEGLALSYALAFIEDVNWREIATHMIDANVDA